MHSDPSHPIPSFKPVLFQGRWGMVNIRKSPVSARWSYRYWRTKICIKLTLSISWSRPIAAYFEFRILTEISRSPRNLSIQLQTLFFWRLQPLLIVSAWYEIRCMVSNSRNVIKHMWSIKIGLVWINSIVWIAVREGWSLWVRPNQLSRVCFLQHKQRIVPSCLWEYFIQKWWYIH